MLATVPPAQQTVGSWQEALALVGTRDAELQTAVVEVERLKGLRREALAAALPTLTATGTATVQILRQKEANPLTGGTTTVPPSPTLTGSISLVQPILAPRAWYAIGTADATTDLAKLSVEDKKRTLVGAAAEAIVSVVSAEHVAEVNRVGLRATLRRLALQKRKVVLGGGANLDVVRFEQDVAAARATLIEGDEALMRAREKLGLVLGSAAPYGVPPDISLDEIQNAALRTCKPGELKDRADLRALRAQKALGERKITDADLMYSPTAQISSTATVSSEQIVGTGHGQWNVQAVLSVPLWDGGFRYGARRAAKAEVEQDEIKLKSLERTATIEVSQANRGVDVATRSLEVARAARDLAAENLRLAQIAFDSGAGTSFDIVDGSRRLREAELSLATKELDVVQAKVSALLATATCAY
jgi:outer membrane protein TolC